MTTTHTPGPWQIASIGSYGITIGDEKKIIGTVHGDNSESIANARLIAAAPELFTIAQAYRNLLRTTAHTEGEVATFQHIENILTKITTP